jgi:hypothetical protein
LVVCDEDDEVVAGVQHGVGSGWAGSVVAGDGYWRGSWWPFDVRDAPVSDR